MTNPIVQVWRDADTLFERLLDLAPATRVAALEAMSPSPELRAAVLRLLAAHEGDGVLDRAPGEVDASPPTDALIGRRLGRWILGEPIGRGGMAVVYHATAVDGSGQVAALKLLTLGGMAGPGVERFRQEQAALARLRHVHIATLFDAGVADDGTPWLAMALVDGVRIDEWCDARRLTTRQRVTLFLDVCDAVASAHANLVVHRDLKPSNVLVDRDGEVRLLDFGIARIVDESNEATLTQWRALTPEYAAPEQFAGEPTSTAVDIYGLGALLYRLLAGRAPRRSSESGDAPIALPSLTGGSAAGLRGDLDAICLRALAIDPGARYATVAAMADDLRRWLAGLPVLAVRPSLVYRARKFARRHRLGTLAVGAMLLILLAGTLAVLWQARRANAQALLAAQNAARATAVRDFLVALFESADPEEAAGSIDTREVVAIGARRAREEFATQPALRSEMLRILGTIQRRLGDYDQAAQTLDAAAAADADARSPSDAAWLDYELGILDSIGGRYGAARERFDRALRRLPDASERSLIQLRANLLGELAILAAGESDFERAFALLDEADGALSALDPPNPQERIVVLNLRASFLNDLGRFAEAFAISARIVDESREERLDQRGTFAQLLTNAAKMAAAAGDLPGAITYAEEAVDVAQQRYPARHTVVADALLALGNALRQAARHEAAIPVLRDSLAMYAALALPESEAEVAMVLARALLDARATAEGLALGERYLLAVDAAGERSSSLAFGLLDVCLRASRSTAPDRYAAHARDAITRLESLPEASRSQPLTQRVRRRLAEWSLQDGQFAIAQRVADGADDPSADLADGEAILLRAVSVQASWSAGRQREALDQFERIATALAKAPDLGIADSEARLAAAVAAVTVAHPSRAALLAEAERADERRPLPEDLADRLDSLRREVR